MTTKKCFEYLVNVIHTTIFATVDERGFPITCAIDLMDFDDDHLYFLTAKGKNFYHRLKNNNHIAFTGIKGRDTLSSIAVSVQGEVKEIGSDTCSDLFTKNPYMEKIYPTQQSRNALTVFQIYKGTGELFDLSKNPIERFSFSFGNIAQEQQGYFVTDSCTGCQLCDSSCPQKCIDFSSIPVIIKQENCLHCGNCYEICPAKAIERR